MRSRKLGESGIEVSAIGLGCWGMSGSYGPADEAESVATLNHALDLGVDFIDTADSYGEDGHNEFLIGRVLGGRRQGLSRRPRLCGSSDQERMVRMSWESMGGPIASSPLARRASSA